MKSKKGYKLVKIDSKTMIEVSVDIPDEVARAKYLENLAERRGVSGNLGKKKKP